MTYLFRILLLSFLSVFQLFPTATAIAQKPNTGVNSGPNPVTRINEVEKVDSKTGLKRPVFPGILLTHQSNEEVVTSRLDMFYSNVMPYSFITQKTAEKLGAVELGEIEFAPFARKNKQSIVQLNEVEKPERNRDTTPIFVDDIVKPVAENTVIVPYADSPIHVPEHLGFYGVNKTKQMKFKVVKVDQVDIGIGLPIGPVNALVIDDENTDFGIIGGNWSSKIKGPNNESLWHLAEGAFVLGELKEPGK